MAAKVAITMTPEQFDDLRAAVQKAALREKELCDDARTRGLDREHWTGHDDCYIRYMRLVVKVLV